MKWILGYVMIMMAAGTASLWAADLTVFSGAGLMKPMDEIIRNFEEENDVQIDVRYGSSGELFGLLGAGQACDVLIPGAEKYTMDALKNGWVEKQTIIRLVRHLPVIVVPKGNPAKIKKLEDLAGTGVRVAIGDPKAPAIGRVARKMFQKAGLWEGITPNILVYAPTVNQLLIYVSLNQVDAAIIWEDLVTWTEAEEKIEIIPIDPKMNIVKTVPTSVCTRTENRKLALRFNAYVAGPEGMAVWKKWGFEACAN